MKRIAWISAMSITGAACQVVAWRISEAGRRDDGTQAAARFTAAAP